MSTTTLQPNAYAVILGKPGTDALTLIGPFTTSDEANAHAAEHVKANPNVPTLVDVLVNPANC